MYTIKNSKPITLKKGKTEIVLDLGIGAWNPDESKLRNLIKANAILAKPWLKFENKWYFITIAWKYNSLEDIAAYFKKDCYSEEIFLEKIMEHIG